MRKLRKKDMTWKKPELLAKFINPSSKILNRYQSRLPTAVHRTATKAIKTARTLRLFPQVGMMKPTDKVPLNSSFEDLEEYS